ncbi:MAG: hypothetical protein V1835_02530, partial [Candidatus Micrarchaeota archaeon]
VSPTPWPSPSPTATITPTPSPTITLTPTPTPTPTPSATPTQTPTPTPSATPTQTPTPTPTITSTPTVTITYTLTPTSTIIPSPSASVGPAYNAPIITQVKATSITQTSAVITWIADIPSDSYAKYGKTTMTLEKYDASLQLSHGLSLSSLLPNTVYQYYVKSCANGLCTTSAQYQFKTLRKLKRGSLGPIGFAVLSVVNEIEPQIDEIKQSGEDTTEIENMVEQSIDLLEKEQDSNARSVIEDARARTNELLVKVRSRMRASKLDNTFWILLVAVLIVVGYVAYAKFMKGKRKKRKGP